MLAFVRKKCYFQKVKMVMPIISLQIPVSELLETIRHLLASGKEVREELVYLAVSEENR